MAVISIKRRLGEIWYGYCSKYAPEANHSGNNDEMKKLKIISSGK